MKKKRTLPESLELLLDTMCNTFGGIIFIAISLIVMSQLVSKTVQKASTEELSGQIENRLKIRIRILQQEISALKNRIEAESLKRFPVTDEKKELIRKLREIRKTARNLRGQIEETDMKTAFLREKLKRLQKEIRSDEKHLQEKESEYVYKRSELNKIQKMYKKQLDSLKNQLEKIQPRTFRFAADENTFQRPYFVLVYSGKIYRFGDSRSPLAEEVKFVRMGDSNVQLIPLKGTGLSATPEMELNHLFYTVDSKEYFIYLSTDLNSYSTLLTARRYFREKGYKVHWEINPEFKFVLSSSVRYQASR